MRAWIRYPLCVLLLVVSTYFAGVTCIGQTGSLPQAAVGADRDGTQMQASQWRSAEIKAAEADIDTIAKLLRLRTCGLPANSKPTDIRQRRLELPRLSQSLEQKIKVVKETSDQDIQQLLDEVERTNNARQETLRAAFSTPEAAVRTVADNLKDDSWVKRIVVVGKARSTSGDDDYFLPLECEVPVAVQFKDMVTPVHPEGLWEKAGSYIVLRSGQFWQPFRIDIPGKVPWTTPELTKPGTLQAFAKVAIIWNGMRLVVGSPSNDQADRAKFEVRPGPQPADGASRGRTGR